MRTRRAYKLEKSSMSQPVQSNVSSQNRNKNTKRKVTSPKVTFDVNQNIAAPKAPDQKPKRKDTPIAINPVKHLKKCLDATAKINKNFNTPTIPENSQQLLKNAEYKEDIQHISELNDTFIERVSLVDEHERDYFETPRKSSRSRDSSCTKISNANFSCSSHDFSMPRPRKRHNTTCTESSNGSLTDKINNVSIIESDIVCSTPLKKVDQHEEFHHQSTFGNPPSNGLARYGSFASTVESHASPNHVESNNPTCPFQTASTDLPELINTYFQTSKVKTTFNFGLNHHLCGNNVWFNFDEMYNLNSKVSNLENCNFTTIEYLSNLANINMINQHEFNINLCAYEQQFGQASCSGDVYNSQNRTTLLCNFANDMIKPRSLKSSHIYAKSIKIFDTFIRWVPKSKSLKKLSNSKNIEKYFFVCYFIILKNYDSAAVRGTTGWSWNDVRSEA